MHSTSLNFFDIQKQALDHIFYEGTGKASEGWKILIMDFPASSIIQSHYNIKNLRENRFILEFPINSNRTPMLDVTAVYLLEATQSNIKAMVEDASKQLYTKVEIHFISSPRKDTISMLCEKLAQKSHQFVKGIKKLDYVNISYTPIDTNLVLLPTVNEVANIIANLKHPPVFICLPKLSGMVDAIKKQLDGMSNYSSKSTSDDCTAVIIGSRDMDYSPVLSLSMMFSHLVVEFGEMIGLNKFKIGKQQITLDSQNKFWLKNKFKHFADASDENSKESRELNQQKPTLSESQPVKLNLQFEQKKNICAKNVSLFGEMNTMMMNERIDKISDSQEFDIKEITELFSIPKNSNQKHPLNHIMKGSYSNERKLRFVINYMLENQKIPLLPELEKLISDIPKPQLYKDIKALDRNSKTFLSQLKSMIVIHYKKETSFYSEVVKKVAKGVDKLDGAWSRVREEGESRESEPKKQRTVKTVLLYVDGGISFLEYQKLQSAASSSGVKLIYAGNRIARSSDILQA